MVIELYSRPACSRCNETKNLLKSRGLTWTEYQVDEDISRDDVKAKFPNASQLPVVVIDGHYIGSKESLYVYLNKAVIED